MLPSSSWHSSQPPTLRGCSGPQLQLFCTTLEVYLLEATCFPQESRWDPWVPHTVHQGLAQLGQGSAPTQAAWFAGAG